MRRADPIWLLAGARWASQSAKVGSYALIGLLSFQFSDGHATTTAAILTLFYVVSLLTAPLAGIAADRFDRRQVMLIADLTAAGCLAALAWSSSLTALTLCAAGMAAAETLFIPAARAAVPKLAAGRLARANGIVGASGAVGYAAGPVIFGVAVSSGSLHAGAGALIVLLLLSAALTGRLPRLPVQTSGAGRAQRDRSGSVLAGWRHIRHNPTLLLTVAALTAVSFSYGLTVPGEVALADALHAGPAGFGALVAAWGGGSAAGALWAARLKETQLSRAMLSGAVGGAACFAAAALAPTLAVAVAAMAVGGLTEGRATVAGNTMLGLHVEDASAGRVFAVSEAAAMAAYAAMIPVRGVLIDAFGVRAVYALAAAAGTLAAVPLLGLLGGQATRASCR